jgi:hypothetical protein
MSAPSHGFFATISPDFGWKCHFIAAAGARIPCPFAATIGDISVGNSGRNVGASLHKFTLELVSGVSFPSGTPMPRRALCANPCQSLGVLRKCNVTLGLLIAISHAWTRATTASFLSQDKFKPAFQAWSYSSSQNKRLSVRIFCFSFIVLLLFIWPALAMAEGPNGYVVNPLPTKVTSTLPCFETLLALWHPLHTRRKINSMTAPNTDVD